MSEDVLDGVNVMCKDVWTNETWLDRCILTLVVCFKIVPQKLTFRSFFSAVLRGCLLHAMIRDLERYLRQWNMIRSFYRGCRVVCGVWFSFLLLNCVFFLPFMVFGLLTIRSHGWGLPKSFECRLLFREFHFYLCLKKLSWKVWTWCAKISGPMKLDSIILQWPWNCPQSLILIFALTLSRLLVIYCVWTVNYSLTRPTVCLNCLNFDSFLTF